MLINYIMGSRLLYGMARHGFLPAILGRIHPKRRTPHVAILVLLGLIVILALAGDVQALASATALLLLFSFAVVNAALVVLKRRPNEPPGGFEVPIFVPILGVLINVTLIVARVADSKADPRAPIIVLWIVLGVTALYFLLRPKNVTEESLEAAEHDAEAI